MEGVAIILVLLFGGLLLYGFVKGLKALPPTSMGGEFAATRRFLALNLCEPAVNVVLIPILASLAGWYSEISNPLVVGLLVTWPMAVLLAPALGLRFRDPDYRAASKKILLIGVSRWGCNILIYGLFKSLIGISLLLILVGVVLLIYSLVWGHGQRTGALAYMPLPPPRKGASLPPLNLRPLAPQPMVAARVAAAPPPIVVYPPDPGVRCPVCQAPSSLRDTTCAACGLVLLSRVPAAFRQLEGYAVLRPLEIGGMSHIYLARAHDDGELCAIKGLAAVDDAAGAEALTCLRREAALLLRLDHPQIVRAREWRDDHAPCLAMPYVPGPTLEAVPLPLPLEAALRHAAAIADALCYLHALPEPIAHCDIKPGNLLLPPDGKPILVDFGSAAHGTETAPERYGTPGYAAPEQYRGQPAPASDIYGLAATLYYLLTGDDPACHPLTFPQLERLPPDLATLLRAALHPNPAERPSALGLREGLRRLEHVQLRSAV